MPPKHLERLGRLLTERGTEARLAAGSMLWREGDPGRDVVLVAEGVLEVLHISPEGHEVVLRKLESGATLGEVSCLDGHPRSASVRAATDARLVRMAGEEFRELLRSHPEILEGLLLQQVELVRSLTHQVTRTHQRAITDPLTKLYNVGYFYERLALELDRARETGDPLSLAMLDIDHFKNYNDSHGHQVGNEALIALADILRSRSRRGDIVARYGGEEFVLLLYGAGREQAGRIAQAIRRRVAARSFYGGATQPLGRVTVSGGVSTFPDDAQNLNALVVIADGNLYRAKRAGRNRIVI